ncbi:hypothetical protein H0H87_002735 [Tephrocybe sp. NHM501043]|nr:hypothetical protein H0H87_002735 [Tephrocybe sp. NHM501043]
MDALLCNSPARIAILGASGMGKKALALSVLHERVVRDRYPSRYFVSCEGIPSVPYLVMEIANALCLALANRKVPLLDAALSLFPENSLLCIDSLESFWDNKTMQSVEELHSRLQLPHLSLIITMRGTQRPFRVSWSEPVLPPLQPLTIEISQHILERADSQPMDSFVKKFLNAADGIPLAISFIATLLGKGNECPESLWNRWNDARSTGPENNGNDRLSILDTSIHLSVYGPDMQADRSLLDILTMLSIADALASPIQPSEALLMAQQVTLVQVATAGKSRRLQMVDPVRAFFKKRLQLPEELRNSITSFYIEMLNCFADIAYPAGRAIVLHEFRNSYAVLMQAWKEGMNSPMLAVASICFTDWSRYLGILDEEMIILATQQVVGLPGLRGSCFQALGEVYLQRGHLFDAEESFNQAVDLHREVHNVLGEANNIRNLGRVHLKRNQLDEAEESFERAAQLHSQT